MKGCSSVRSFSTSLPLLPKASEAICTRHIHLRVKTFVAFGLMPRWLPSIPYPPSQDGYWSPITSTINWCEEVSLCSWWKDIIWLSFDLTLSKDYYATIYSAEVVNSVTNLLFMYLAGKGIINCKRNDHPSIFFVLFAGYLVIGVGSFLFHNTLKCSLVLSSLSSWYPRSSVPLPFALCQNISQKANRNQWCLFSLLPRSYAADRWAVDDLHHLHHVVRNLFAWQNAALLNHISSRFKLPCAFYHRILSLSKGSYISSERICYTYGNRSHSHHVPNGNQTSTIAALERGR